PTGSSSTNPFR
nr:Chain B, PTGSSSTNPFR [synthetic construct]